MCVCVYVCIQILSKTGIISLTSLIAIRLCELYGGFADPGPFAQCTANQILRQKGLQPRNSLSTREPNEEMRTSLRPASPKVRGLRYLWDKGSKVVLAWRKMIRGRENVS